MKFLVLLTISAASAVTVYRNEDSMAMETKTRATEDDQQEAAITIYPKKERLKQYLDDYPRGAYTAGTRHKTNQEDQQRGSYYPKQERQKLKETDQQRGAYYPKHNQEVKTPPKKFNPVQSNQEQFFENIQEAANNGHKMGYSSFVQHHDETDVAGQGSSDIQKTVPKSSVQVEMYHGPELATKKPVHFKEPGSGKLRNKPRIYQDTLANYKKAKNSFPGSSSNTPVLVKDLPSTTPKYFTPSQPKFQPTFPKRRPYNKRHESDTQFQAAEETVTRTDGNPTSHSEGNTLATSAKYSQHLSQRYLKYGKPAEMKQEKPQILHHVHDHTESPLLEIRGPRWTALSDSVEIATSEEVKPKSKRSRHPKEIHSLSSYGQFFNSEPQQFDHEKALRSSTSFGVSNVMFGSDLSEDVKETVLEGGSAFNIVHGYDIAKAVEAQKIGASQGPVQFGSEHGQNRIPKHNTVNAGNFEIPVMTEEEFERHFGKYRAETKKPFRPVQRQPFDARPKQIKQPVLNFPQFNGNVWAQSQNVPVVKQPPQLDMQSSLSYLLPSKKNISLQPERHGRVLSDETSEPQQFSVSASYQIDRNHGNF